MIYLDGTSLNLEKLRMIAERNEPVGISDDAAKNVKKSRDSLMKIVSSGANIYGVNTGFGSLLNVRIKPDKIEELQRNLIRSHSAGVGEPLDARHVRAIMAIRANSLCKGYSGVSVELVEKILEFLNEDIIPYVPRYGSVGASGDLAPLAHIGLCLMGEGFVLMDGKRVDVMEVLNRKSIEPYSFKSKESISFINGTATITGILSLETSRAIDLLKNSIASASMSFEALRGTRKAFQGWAIETRNHAGQVNIAKIMREILNDSKICLESESRKVQDAYSLRCIPQVYGAVEDTIRYVKSVLEIELNSATDNPLVNDTEFISAGNFHGEPVAFASDFLGIALCDLGNIIERRIARITDEKLSDLPPFLVKDSGLNSGYMIAQYTAAALCNRNKTLAVPSSIDTIPTCANQEDHVSMGTNSAIKLTELVKNLRQIIAIEYVLAAQALDLLEEEPCSFNELLRSEIRESIDHLHEDRPVFRDIEKMVEIIENSREFDKIISDIHVNV